MSRKREYTLHLRCHHEGCKETSFYSYPTQRDYREAVKRRADAKWNCVRHNDDKLLTLDKLTASRTIISGKSKRYPNLPDLFWDDCSGFEHGSAWKAFAKDFPVGTKIIETVQVILPDSESAGLSIEIANDQPKKEVK